MSVLRKYGVATTILFPLIDAGAQDFEATPVTFVAADTQISKNEGAFANTFNAPVHEGKGFYSLTLTDPEMQAARIVITIIDSATKAWEDQAVIIDTYGNASAQHAFDLDSAIPAANVINWQGSAVNTLVSGRVDTRPGALAAGVITAASIASDALSLAKFATDALEGIADSVLKRPISNVEPSAAWRTLYGAVASLVNRARINVSGNLEVYKTDDTAILETLVGSEDAEQNPITELDPP